MSKIQVIQNGYYFYLILNGSEIKNNRLIFENFDTLGLNTIEIIFNFHVFKKRLN